MAKKAKKAAQTPTGPKSSTPPGGGKAVPAAGPTGKIGKGTEISSVMELIQLMVNNDLSEMEICDGEVRVHLRRGGVPAPAPAPAEAPVSVAPKAEVRPPPEQLLEVKSPMVGTFYAAPSPDSEPYVSPGTLVDDDTVVCIVEAMKVMNEIRADCAGTVVEICVQNAQPVEYGQMLFRVRPA